MVFIFFGSVSEAEDYLILGLKKNLDFPLSIHAFRIIPQILGLMAQTA